MLLCWTQTVQSHPKSCRILENIGHLSTFLLVHRVHDECYSSFRKEKVWWFICPPSTCFLILHCQGPRGIWWISVRRLMKWLEISAELWSPFSSPELPWTCTFRKGFLKRFHHLRLRRPPVKSNRLKFSFISHDKKPDALQQAESEPFSAWCIIQLHLSGYIFCIFTPKTVSESQICHKFA